MTGRRAPAGSGRDAAAALSGLAGRLTGRDRWIAAMVFEHQVLTGPQIGRMCFDGARMARQRLATLHQLDVLDRLRPALPPPDRPAGPFLGPASQPYHYLLGLAGAHVLAAERGISVRQLRYRREEQLAVAFSPRVGHLVGVNDLFTRWVHASRPRPAGQGLTVWWSERRAARIWGDLTRPDGYGVWTTPHRRLEFFLEYDTGSSALGRLSRKLPGYHRLAQATAIRTPLLIWLPTPRREAAARAQLPTGLPVPIATASPAFVPGGLEEPDPAGPVWLPLDQAHRYRFTVDQLADLYGHPHPTPPSPVAGTDDGEADGVEAPDPRPPGR